MSTFHARAAQFDAAHVLGFRPKANPLPLPRTDEIVLSCDGWSVRDLIDRHGQLIDCGPWGRDEYWFAHRQHCGIYRLRLPLASSGDQSRAEQIALTHLDPTRRFVTVTLALTAIISHLLVNHEWLLNPQQWVRCAESVGVDGSVAIMCRRDQATILPIPDGLRHSSLYAGTMTLVDG